MQSGPQDQKRMIFSHSVISLNQLRQNSKKHYLLSTPMGVDYVLIGFDMEVQPLVTHNAA